MAENRATKLKELFAAIDPDRVTKEDMKVLIDAITERLEMRDKDLEDKAAMLADAVEQAKIALEQSKNDTRTELQTETQTRLGEAITTLQERIAAWETRIASVKDGETPDIEEVAQAAAALIQLPEYRAPLMDGPEEIRNKLEAAYAETDEEEERLDPRIIRGFQKLLEDIEELKNRPSGGSVNLSPVHWPRHEVFTMDGIATFVSLVEGVGAEGTAIFGVRYQGQTLDLGENYTVNGNKITFVGFVPDAGTIISVSYMS